MSDWSVLAAKASSIASDVSAGIAHAIGTGAADGFAVGTVLTGASFMLVISRRRARMQRSQAGAPGDVALVALPSDPSEFGSADEAVEMLVVTTEPRPDSEPLASQPKDGRNGKHRVTDHGAVVLRWPDAKRSAPRHAAPSASTKLASVVSLGPVAARS
jgi:hypothetical protein